MISPLIVVIGPTVKRATDWSNEHVIKCERRPIIIDHESLDRLRGTRGFCIVLLPETFFPVELSYMLDKNTVIDLRG